MCSRVLWADNDQAVVVGRNMDWKNPWPIDLWLLPRGIERDGGAGENMLRWTARHGSVVASFNGASDGMNEAGLAAHMLWLSESDYGARDPARPGLRIGLWLQYYLDNFASVKEAVAWTETSGLQLVTGAYDGSEVAVHLALEDADGDSAIIEYAAGRPHIHHGRSYTVLTNSPPFEQQLAQLERYTSFGGTEPLPGTTDPADRYVRAAYYLAHLPTPANYRETVAGMLSVMRNVAQPFGIIDPARPNVSPTRWRTISDLTNGVYYFESTSNPTIVWAKLPQLDVSVGAPAQKVDLVNDPDRIGDVTGAFVPAEPFTLPSEAA